jgi:S-adenosylmethionine/arginine decarboxylase-like enzyme
MLQNNQIIADLYSCMPEKLNAKALEKTLHLITKQAKFADVQESLLPFPDHFTIMIAHKLGQIVVVAIPKQGYVSLDIQGNESVREIYDSIETALNPQIVERSFFKRGQSL